MQLFIGAWSRKPPSGRPPHHAESRPGLIGSYFTLQASGLCGSGPARVATPAGTYGTGAERLLIKPKIADTTNKMIATKKIIFAISTEMIATPPKPSTAAINATNFFL
jgi:hypothetical protein